MSVKIQNRNDDDDTCTGSFKATHRWIKIKVTHRRYTYVYTQLKCRLKDADLFLLNCLSSLELGVYNGAAYKLIDYYCCTKYKVYILIMYHVLHHY